MKSLLNKIPSINSPSYGIVTGASRGIGRSIAIKMAENGVNLAICCRNSVDMLEELGKELEQNYGISVICQGCDVGDPDSVSAMKYKVLENFPHIDYMVNNAGISFIGLITDMSVEDWNRMIAVNLSSLFYMTKAFIPSMIHQKRGSVLNISSMWGNVGASCEVAYSASKGGVNLYTKALARELAPSGIRVNAIAPGCVDTDMNSFFSPEEKKDLENQIPLGRFASPDEIADAAWSVMNLTYVTGQILTADGAFI
ncbi:elongation factor P 5-aminopentanone reductase [Candidatus Weimeria sp. HCP3S3_B5]|uniref:elongation factor P 5-aminopentanone reductase n=1 Tax=Candidatus Weimeria sp. HCP3S3_B5 TaxID=3438871 RepID=UPI003F8BD3DD